MERKFKRGYIEKGWYNTLEHRFIENEYAISISKVIQTNDVGEWQDVDEDEIDSFGGYQTKQDAINDLIKKGCKEIVDSDNGLKVIWSKLK